MLAYCQARNDVTRVVELTRTYVYVRVTEKNEEEEEEEEKENESQVVTKCSGRRYNFRQRTQ